MALAPCARAQGGDARLSSTDIARFHAALEAARLRTLIDAEWEWRLQDTPELATALGDRRYDDRWTDASPAAVVEREAHQRGLLSALTRVDPDALIGEDRLSFEAALQPAQAAVDEQRYPALRTRVLSSLDGVQLSLPATMRAMPMRSEADARRALARLRAMPTRIAQDIAWAREGQRLGWVTARSSLGRVLDQIDALLARPLTQSPLIDPLNRLPGDIPPARRQALLDEAVAVVRDQVLPAYLDLRKLIALELLPANTDDGGLGSHPDGAAIYALLLREQTTLAPNPRQVHDAGIREMALIQADLAEAVINRDPKFFAASADELLADYRDIAKRVDPELPRLFATLPRAPYGVRGWGGDTSAETSGGASGDMRSETSADTGADAAARYMPGALDGTTAGWLDVDVTAPAQRPTWAMAASFLSMGVPGRHLQAARAHELVQLPTFRRVGGPNAYVDGWAFYAVDLGAELGVFADPAARFGPLKVRALHTARVVVDTGLHALGWTRLQAAGYLVDQAGLTPDEAAREIDACLARPARALAGPLGEHEILELRRQAAGALGERFDLRSFHQELLDHGALPLPQLDQVIADWIARTKSSRLGN